jgi:uncharacterized membrane protein (UPF0127 family)
MEIGQQKTAVVALKCAAVLPLAVPPIMRLALLLTLSLLLPPTIAGAQEATQTSELPLTQLQLGMHIVRAEVANTDESRVHGLMGRKALPGNQGMLFVFERPDRQAMWMRNTLIPLSVAFIGDDGRILNIEEMKPQTEDVHPSKGDAKFALEMSGGWFANKGIKAGDRIKGLENAPPAH